MVNQEAGWALNLTSNFEVEKNIFPRPGFDPHAFHAEVQSITTYLYSGTKFLNLHCSSVIPKFSTKKSVHKRVHRTGKDSFLIKFYNLFFKAMGN
jgi:hypothetical protein